MNMEEVKAISLKALVDKENNRLIFAEADEDFTDVLFSFLTMPMGTIIRILSNHNQPSKTGIGCMNNLYESIKNLDMLRFRSETCKTMLLCPRNVAAPQNKRLKLQIDDFELPRYFLCSRDCTLSSHKLLSLYPKAVCECGRPMDRAIELSDNNNVQKLVFDARDRGVFVQGLTQFIISDELQVKPSSVEASLSVVSKLGYMDFSTIEEHNIDIGVDEVLTLLKCSLVSKKPLTETLLKQNSAPKFGKDDFDQKIYVESKLQESKSSVDVKIHGREDFGQNVYVESRIEEPESNLDVKILGKEDFDKNIYIESKVEEPESNVDGKINVKLIISKSTNTVCYAEASEEFVNLISNFLTVPLGYIIKTMQSSISKGSLIHLYNSVQELDAEKYFKSNEHKDMLISPKLAPNSSYENHPLGFEEALHPTYCYAESLLYLTRCQLTSDGKIPSVSKWKSSILNVKDPKTHFKEAQRGGFVTGPTMFTVTDNLIITPISQISSLFLLQKLKLPLGDIEERVMHVGSEEASCLLVASFVSESALTNVFLREPNPGF